MQSILMVIIMVIGFVLSRTKLGYHVYAVGGGARAAHLHGVPVAKIKIFSFVFTGFLAAFAGIIALSFVRGGYPHLGYLMELDIIAAVVIGGVSIQGGRGSIQGVFLGVLVWALISNALVLLGVSPYANRIVMGGTIIGAVAVNTIRVRPAYLRA
jgi:ribose/xylose/arabinose/galactoside ABC-type transport system permease subunit